MSHFLAFWQSWGASVIGATLLILSGLFLLRFIIPAWQIDRQLRRANQQLATLGERITPAERAQQCAQIFAVPGLQHLWREYAQTLHRPEQAGGMRATAMAGSYFTEQALVDTPLKTSFYKHLPGILTGIGIIGTFSGLIIGLSSFQVSDDAAAVRGSLEGLIRSVGHAFEISAVAITLAMLFTWIEKSLTTRLYRAVEQLAQRIDSLFDAGVGEDYLARLVRAAETAASQGEQQQRALVNALRQGLRELLAEQQATSQQQQAALAGQIAEAVSQTLARTLGSPLQRMTQALEGLGDQQQSRLAQSLDATLLRFSQQLDQSLGQRHGDIDALLARTAHGLQQIVSELSRLTARLESSGQGALQTATGQLQSAGDEVQRLGGSLASMGSDMATAARAMQSAAQAASQAISEQGRLQDNLVRMLGDLRATVDAARREASLTDDLVSRLEHGAASLASAQSRADDYLQTVNQVLGEAHSAFAEHLEQTLARGNGQFQRQVVSAVEALHGAIEQLSDALYGERVGR